MFGSAVVFLSQKISAQRVSVFPTGQGMIKWTWEDALVEKSSLVIHVLHLRPDWSL